MKIIITGKPEEIADLVSQLQNQQLNKSKFKPESSFDEDKAITNPLLEN